MSNIPEAPLVPPVVDEAELIGLGTSDPPIIEAEPSQVLDPPLDTAEQQGLLFDRNIPQSAGRNDPGISGPNRPGLQRGNSVPTPAPLHLPPPVPPGSLGGNQTADPLSITQLQGLAKDLTKVELAPYAFTYDDASCLEEEIEEWFSYSVEEQAMLLKAQTAFTNEWNMYRRTADGLGNKDWSQAEENQEIFMRSLLTSIRQSDPVTRLRKLEALVYILLGCWHESAGLGPASSAESTEKSPDRSPKAVYGKSARQIRLLRSNVRLLIECGGLPILVKTMKSACLRACGVDVDPTAPRDGKEAERREVWCSMTAIYVVLEVARIEEKENQDLSIRSALLALNPGIFIILAEIVAKMRWDDSINLSLPKICLLLWKTALVSFGGLSEVEKAKETFNKDLDLESEDARGQPIITASPLDYHAFRQEISSKYPAYNPPPPLFPLEPENNSILPPLKNHPNRAAGNHVFGSGLGDMNGNNTSIFHQPVHIATPAPSPPPSPAGPGGKGGKKQNYQTNQMFPFLYPPLDESSNKLGGKGSTDLQDLLVGRKWEGADIPTSILEAAELFSKRMRATRAMKQLWEERVQFMKYERGWSGADEDIDVEALSLEPKADEQKPVHPSGSTEERLDLVEECYRAALPHLQSLVIVLIKAILTHVTTLVTQSNGPNGLQSGFHFQDHQNGPSHMNGINGHDNVTTNEELDAMRTQEILDKAVSGILILMLKWFKVSHILKFEYITQLLVDSSYVPLILKLLQLQEVDKAVAFKCEQEELNFFYFCRTHSRAGIEENIPSQQQQQSSPGDPDTTTQDHEPEADSDSDDAAPPPIRTTRRNSNPDPQQHPSPDQMPLPPGIYPPLQQAPEVDELGFPTTQFPTTPITTYSFRAFFTTINYLRIMQKVCKNKAHRNLMLVSYKSSQFLRKSLKVPEPSLRLYTLKLFKNQVPYCGRKWRQTNMRVITAVYLTCRPELRDDWLAGSDVDAEVDESVPLEQALRALTHWFNLRRYPEGMGARMGVLEDEQDFFRRELEKMDWSDLEFLEAAAAAEAAEAGSSSGGGGVWDAQQLDGWS
ncbi:N1221-domain-containing protein [Aaosphaeria arxii CBS 175.79]|uniref:N1221-domain-containing protein n=1 Tax=Aaosphaeria arxii CBS 175.79 TaxID=1450172 RepID=A0A6A5XVA2_9PLEO|nr:N1221-domain-containing protein [Aaosphaeria arxii CBS 175.79]KAF2016560.1 N1221-domain-containing protein [Aaosphaeria arxii CBS 175.79]